MNTRAAVSETSGPVALSVAFNQDSTCFSVGLDTGFCVFSSDPCELKASRDFNAGIGTVWMLGQGNYLALVGGGRQPKFPQNKVIIWDDGKAKAVITLEFRSSVHKVAMSRSRIVVALQNSVHIYAFSSPPKKLSSFETADNPLGLCCLGQKLIAFPGRTPGQVQLIEVDSGNVSIIPAHSTPLRALALSPDGDSLATASETGTIVRTFNTANCSKTSEFRRGVDKAMVFSLAFSPDNSMLAMTSDKSTLHIFDLSRPTSPTDAKGGYASSVDSSEDANPALSHQKYGFLSRLPLLPRVFSDVYSSCSTQFSSEDAEPGAAASGAPVNSSIPGLTGGKAAKGVIGWLNEWTVLVIGAGRDGRWEKFMLGEDERGKRVIGRRGWKRYIGADR